MLPLLWLVPLLPFAGFAVNGLFGARFLSRRVVGLIACAAVLASFVISAGAFVELHDRSAATPFFTQDLFEWMPMGQAAGGSDLTVRWSYLLDPLSAVMLLVVTGVGFLIHVYSVGYMEHEPQAAFARFFAYLNLFMAMMLVLVLGASLPVVFVGWEGDGLCSYLLMGFYYDRMFDEKTKMSCADAGRKAFITNRIGDVGFILGMLLLFAATGTLDIQGILAKVGTLGTGVCTAAALLLFFGACGKSAQIPLYVWLPDAMAGPTPVSALIHAATMVTAGLYMVTRTNVIFQHSQTMMMVEAIVGAATAIFAATIGITQNDIKRVLAYSTVSQLGFMFMACGVGAFAIGIFHVMTHAFFKALMFLGAGSVIHGMHHEQDMRRMGGLKKYMPITYLTFLAGWLAICGIPPFSGFWSKDEILWNAASTRHIPVGWIVWLVGTIAATCTAFYMTRLMAMTFWGKEKFLGKPAGGEADEAHASAFDKGLAKHDAKLKSAGDRPRHEPGEHVGQVDHHVHIPHESPRS